MFRFDITDVKHTASVRQIRTPMLESKSTIVHIMLQKATRSII